MQHDKVLILDFGSQYTQLIARRVRELNIYSEIHPFNKIPINIEEYKAVILSGSPFSVRGKEALHPDLSEIRGKKPILAVCYGAQYLAHFSGGEVAPSNTREYGRANLSFIKGNEPFFAHVHTGSQVWMSHSDTIKTLPSKGVLIASTHDVANAAYRIDDEETYAIQFHPEVYHSTDGKQILENFLVSIAGLHQDWTPDSFVEETVEAIKEKVGEVFDDEAHKLEDVKWLAQGTIYPDVIESVSATGGPSATIKSHHNVGGLPDFMKLKIVEPLRAIFKDEVRRVGATLGIDPELLGRHPFPGPGLGIRILGDITAEKVRILQEVDAIFINGLKEWGLYDKVWQAGAMLLPVNSVGVMGDERTYEKCVALRAVESTDGMTADWVNLPYEFLQKTSNDIINKVKGVNRVVYDISSKPPATIEWE
ncbi:UNVERIFIED_CONTAM: hypothetical protein GTU68_055195 [Idotea baltica]|nr:hypothetical protein [Idotea baltica]